MSYTITANAQYNSLEIFFDGKPTEAIRDALKEMRFRWHGQKKCWYGYRTEEEVRAAIDGKPAADSKPAPKAKKAEAVNKYGVKVGDIFRTSWGYEQTNNQFFQVVALVGAESVRVREVYLPLIESEAVSWASEDRVFQIVRDILPPADRSVFIKDQERGDVKRLKSFDADGVSNPQFKLSSYADAWICNGDTVKVYESWYA